jgi:endonuclease YncB( thermonuclease family)
MVQIYGSRLRNASLRPGAYLAVSLILTLISPGWAADAIINDADTLRLGGTSYRLDGIDAPELDQTCLDEKGNVWPCGIEAKDQLAALVGSRAVQCEDKGPDSAYPTRRIGICSIEGEATSLNQWLVREGWALNFEPYAKGRFKSDEADARDNRRGVWKGCLTAPRDLRRWNKRTAKLLGPACPTIGDTKARNDLFPDDPAMPPGCSIKGNFAVRAQLTGHRGIYHMEGCRSYRRTKTPNRWFCTEEDAKAAGFRKAFNC